VLAAGAAGAISGSAVVRIIEEHASEQVALLPEVGRFVWAMKAATKS
jgi:tryptophan synthase alpha chain